MTATTRTPLNAWRLAIRGAELPTVAKLVAYTLATYLDSQTLRAFPSQATLAADCGIQIRHLRNALAALKAGGWITTTRHRNGLSYYATFGLENQQQDRHPGAGLESQDRHPSAGQTGTPVPPELDRELDNPPNPPITLRIGGANGRKIPTAYSRATVHRIGSERARQLVEELA